MAENLKFEAMLWQTIEGQAIKALLSGNDTQSFTTEQYSDALDQAVERMCGVSREMLGLAKPGLEVRRRQLRACPLVREVGADVWTVVSPEELVR